MSPLTERERWFQRLTDQVPALIWYCGPDRRCRYVNQTWLGFTGRTAEQELGTAWLDAVHPEDRARCLAAIETAFAAREPFTIEFRLRRHDGAYRWVSDHGRPFWDDDGTFAGYACSAVEIHRYRYLRRALQRALGAVHDQRILLAELRHRAKNTVQLIGSLLSLLARQVTEASAPAVREMARRVRAFGLAHEALDQATRTGAIDLGRYLTELALGLVEIGQQRGIRLDARTEPGLMLPINRAVPLGLVVNELVTNALKHSFPGETPGGTVMLEVRRRADGRIEVVVADDGVGLPEGAWPPRGTGSLGLPLVAGLARQARAEVAVNSAGGGTRFTLTFTPEPEARSSKPTPAPVLPQESAA